MKKEPLHATMPAEQKRDADYAVAKEKCDVYAGGAKDYCVDQAKARFGKS